MHFNFYISDDDVKLETHHILAVNDLCNNTGMGTTTLSNSLLLCLIWKSSTFSCVYYLTFYLSLSVCSSNILKTMPSIGVIKSKYCIQLMSLLQNYGICEIQILQKY